MTQKTILAILITIVFHFLSGCATVGVSSYSYKEPTSFEIENEAFVPMPFDQAWDKLVRELATRFYVVNNIDKESRLINVSFSSNNPEQFVTGGTTTREFRRDGPTERISYDPASSSSFKTGWKWGPYKNLPSTGTLYRRTSLEGRVNIYAAPDGDGMRMTVNCRYILTVKVTGTFVAENAFGTPMQTGVLPSSTETASLSTDAPVRVNWGTPAEPSWVTLRSTGKLENDILSILK